MYSTEYAPPPEWRSGLFDCSRDCGTCCVGYCVPCVLYAVNGQKVRGLNSRVYWTDFFVYYLLCIATGCQFILGMQRRMELRTKYNLPEEPCSDCCVHFCCHPCALCQEGRELDARLIEAVHHQIPMQNVEDRTAPQMAFASTPPQEAAGPSGNRNVFEATN